MRQDSSGNKHIKRNRREKKTQENRTNAKFSCSLMVFNRFNWQIKAKRIKTLHFIVQHLKKK